MDGLRLALLIFFIRRMRSEGYKRIGTDLITGLLSYPVSACGCKDFLYLYVPLSLADLQPRDTNIFLEMVKCWCPL